MAGSGSLGDVVRDRRRALGLTQEQLAERIGDGVRQAEVSRIERGRVGLPRRRRLERIAAALELSAGELLVRSGWSGADVAAPRPATGSPPTLRVVRTAGSESQAIRELREALAHSRQLRERTDQLLYQATRIAQTIDTPHAGARPPATEQERPLRR